ncbi:uncharacterized protein LOC143486810 isoform X2 [Brachyhypopomus gauderio]|uniref:uncharacterized protein LOC143486810 isoform X2 n=1 Tax=Brachyhypopomus gauderio TaxID=698409 RepID=UPI004041FCB6
MDAKTVPKEKPKFAPPIARAGKTGANKVKEDDKREVSRKRTGRPGATVDQVGAKLSSVLAPGVRNTGEISLGNMGLVIQCQKEEVTRPLWRKKGMLADGTDAGQETKKRGKEQTLNPHDGAPTGGKRAKSEKTRCGNRGKIEGVQMDEHRAKMKQKGPDTERTREREKRGKAQLLTDAQYDEIFESVLECSTLDLMKDAKTMLTEVELLQASLEQDTCRAGETEGTEECGTVQLLRSTWKRESERERERGRQEETLLREERNDQQYVLWVQCSRADCGKWRRLNEDVDPSVLPDDWICEQNSDPVFSSCLAPEETFSGDDEENTFYNLVPGSLVWAHQSGYPWWPAVVERDPDSNHYLQFRKKTDLTPYKCHVTYFGDPVCRTWVPCSRVKGYADLSEEDVFSTVKNEKLKKRFKDAVRMSKQALKLPLKRRLVKFGFWIRYVSERESSEEDSDIAEVLSLFSGKRGKSREHYSDKVLKQERWLKRGEGKSETHPQDQTVPQSAMETTPMTPELGPHSEEIEKNRAAGGGRRGEREGRREGEGRVERDVEQGERRESWEDDFNDEDEASPKYEDEDEVEGGFLGTDMEILACRDKMIKPLSSSEEEEEEEGSDFSLMLLEEE